jgi:hypothetical protein
MLSSVHLCRYRPYLILTWYIYTCTGTCTFSQKTAVPGLH